MSESKHSQGSLTVSGSYLMDPEGVCIAEAVPGQRKRGRTPVAANAARLALCWNSHDELVAALKRIADAKADGLDGARDTAVLERAIALANRTLAKLSPT